MSCVFCNLSEENWLAHSAYFYAVWDIDPIQEGHLLVISKKHRMAIAELSNEEKLDLIDFQNQLIEKMEKSSTILGVTLIINNGKLMDAGIHFHSHLIPRYEDDGFWNEVSPKKRAFPKNQL